MASKVEAVPTLRLVPVLKGGTLAERSLFWHYPHYGNQGGEPSAIHLRDDWKLIHYFEDGRNELYHVGRDIGEQQDLYHEYPERVEAMLKGLKAWQKSVAAVEPTVNPDWDAGAYEEAMRQVKDKNIPNRDRQHARILEKDYVPSGGWWENRGWKK